MASMVVSEEVRWIVGRKKEVRGRVRDLDSNDLCWDPIPSSPDQPASSTDCASAELCNMSHNSAWSVESV